MFPSLLIGAKADKYLWLLPVAPLKPDVMLGVFLSAVKGLEAAGTTTTSISSCSEQPHLKAKIETHAGFSARSLSPCKALLALVLLVLHLFVHMESDRNSFVKTSDYTEQSPSCVRSSSECFEGEAVVFCLFILEQLSNLSLKSYWGTYLHLLPLLVAFGKFVRLTKMLFLICHLEIKSWKKCFYDSKSVNLNQVRHKTPLAWETRPTIHFTNKFSGLDTLHQGFFAVFVS